MATELIKSERTISLLKKGAKRLNDGGGLYLLPFAGGDTHYWRLDYVFQGRRKTLSLGSHPQVTLEMAREKAQGARAILGIVSFFSEPRAHLGQDGERDALCGKAL